LCFEAFHCDELPECVKIQAFSDEQYVPHQIVESQILGCVDQHGLNRSTG